MANDGHHDHRGDGALNEPNRAIDDLRAADTAAETLGIVVHQANPGRVDVGMVVRDDMLNFGGTCHGGVLFHLADTAMSYVSNQDQPPAVATAASIDYVSPANLGDEIRAVVTTNIDGRNAVHDGVISALDGRVIALFRGKTLRLRAAT